MSDVFEFIPTSEVAAEANEAIWKRDESDDEDSELSIQLNAADHSCQEMTSLRPYFSL